jgi:outer membrane immunogenic protein
VASSLQQLEVLGPIVHVGLGAVIMRKLLIGSLVALTTIGGTAAMAADMPLKAPPPPPVFSWTGCYVGIEGGGAWGRSKHRAPLTPSDITTWFDVSGGVAGVEYGCNQQFGGNWVFGIEGDWSWSNKRGSLNQNVGGFNPLINIQTKERWVSTSRMRIGWTWDRAWFYVTGGFAAARVDLNEDASAVPGFGQNPDRKTVFSYVVGAGLEYAFWNNWSLKAEYLFMDFGENGYFTPPPPGFGTRSFLLNDHIVRVGLNWRFTDCAFGSCDGPAPAPVYTK